MFRVFFSLMKLLLFLQIWIQNLELELQAMSSEKSRLQAKDAFKEERSKL